MLYSNKREVMTANSLTKNSSVMSTFDSEYNLFNEDFMLPPMVVKEKAFAEASGRTAYATLADKENRETFRVKVPGRPWVIRNNRIGLE